MNNKKLALILVALVVIYLLGRLISGKSERNFDSSLVTVDTAAVDEISMTGPHGTILLNRNGQGWTVSDGKGKEVPAVKNMVQGVLGNLVSIQSQRIITSTPEKWPNYEVTDSSGTHVIASKSGKALTDLIVGRFAFNQATRSGTSYVRMAGDNNVHAVDGFLSMSFSRDLNSFRDKTLAALSADEVKTLELQDFSQAMSYTLQKGADGKWDLSGIPVDSVTVAGYLANLRFLNGNTFDDAFTPDGKKPLYAVSISTNQQLDPLQIACYQGSNTAMPFVFHSTVNPDGYFASDSSQLFQTVIQSFLEMVPHDQ